jgi:hypothetical protein
VTSAAGAPLLAAQSYSTADGARFDLHDYRSAGANQ